MWGSTCSSRARMCEMNVCVCEWVEDERSKLALVQRLIAVALDGEASSLGLDEALVPLDAHVLGVARLHGSISGPVARLTGFRRLLAAYGVRGGLLHEEEKRVSLRRRNRRNEATHQEAGDSSCVCSNGASHNARLGSDEPCCSPASSEQDDWRLCSPHHEGGRGDREGEGSQLNGPRRGHVCLDLRRCSWSWRDKSCPRHKALAREDDWVLLDCPSDEIWRRDLCEKDGRRTDRFRKEGSGEVLCADEDVIEDRPYRGQRLWDRSLRCQNGI